MVLLAALPQLGCVGLTSAKGPASSTDPARVIPSITTQPASQTVTVGQSATFSVTCTGKAPLSYLWRKNGTAISGAGSANYTTPATATSDAGSQFSVVINNSTGSVTSNAATLMVTTAPVAPSITIQPTSQTVSAGQTAVFSVTASGTAPLSYQWQKNGTAINGAASATYTTPATATSEAGSQFSVVINNLTGSVTSNTATLTVNAAAVAPSITAQPVSQMVTAGQTTTFSVTASGTAPFSYQWRRNGTAVSSATSASYTIPRTATSDSRSQFSVIVSNSTGSVTSNAATLTVTVAATAPTIPTQPASQTVTVGKSATFSVTGSGMAPLSYQWTKNGQTISGAIAATYTTPATTGSDNGAQFAVVVSNSAGSLTSNTAALMVNAVPAGQLTTSAPSLNFNNVNVGSNSALGVTFTNSGNSNITISNVNISGPGLNGSGVSAGLILTPSQTATLNVTFTPAATGSVTGGVTVTSNASNSSLKISLSGTGTMPTLGHVFNVASNGAVPDSKEGYHCAITAGSRDLVCQDVSFTNGDTTHAIVVYGAVANVSTASTIAVSPGSVTVKPDSMANIVTGTVLYCENADGSNYEQLVVSGITGSSFTATFAKSKSGTWNISSSYLALYSTISSVTNPSTVVLATRATQTVSSGMVQIAGAIDNWKPIQNTINSACSAATQANPSTVSFPAGIYGLSNTVFIPTGCSYLSWTATGKVVLLETSILSIDATNRGFGQGGSLLAFSYEDAPGKGSASLANNTSISAHSNVLRCGSGCNFTTSDIGQPLYLQYAGDSGLPLWTTITGVSGTPRGNVYPAVTLATDAQTTLPLTPQGMAGPAVVFGYQVMRNIDIGGIDFHNMGYWFQPGITTIGYPLVSFGTAIRVVKQGLKFHDSTLISATNGCLGNNGPNDQYLLKNVTCLGMTDAAFYMAGLNSNVTIEDVVVDNTQYPVPGTPLTDAFLLKTLSHALIVRPVVRCHCLTNLISISDYANFATTIENADLDGEGSTPGAIGANIATGLTVLNAKIQNIKGNAFRFDNAYVGGINGVTITGTNAFNISGGGIWINDGTRTGHGPSNITFENNEMQVLANGINAQKLEGTNHWSGNQLINAPASANAAWQIYQGRSGATNVVKSNAVVGYQGRSYCDSSCVF